MKKLKLSISIVMLLQAAAAAATIYVDNQLTDDCIGTYSIEHRNNSGSDGDAYNTPQEAADISNPGDIIYFRAGTYTISGGYSKSVMIILRDGTVENPVTYQSYNGEEVIFSGAVSGTPTHGWAVRLGVAPSTSSPPAASGEGVTNIILDGLSFTKATVAGLGLFGEQNPYGDTTDHSENITIKNCYFFENETLGLSYGAGIMSMGKIKNLHIEYCEAYNNTGCGFNLSTCSKHWDDALPDDNMNNCQGAIINDCLFYNNNHPLNPGNTDGMTIAGGYNCTVRNCVFYSNSDDGLDIYQSVNCNAFNNISFYNVKESGGQGFKFSAGGGGGHTIAGNVSIGNTAFGFENSDPANSVRVYRPSHIYNNTSYNDKGGFAVGISYNLTYPEFPKVLLRNNIGLDSTTHDIFNCYSEYADSDYNLWSISNDLISQHASGTDAHSLTGDAELIDKEAGIDTHFGAGWTLRQKLDYIRSQVLAAFSPAEDSQLIDKGVLIDGYHCPYADDDPVNPMDPDAPGRHWLGAAPDIGALEYGLDPYNTNPDPEPGQPNDPIPPAANPIPTKTEMNCYNNVINPAKGEEATIHIELDKQARVTVVIYDSKGREIKKIMDEQKQPGFYTMQWDGKNNSGDSIGSGIYLVYCKAGEYSETKKVAVIK